MIAGVGDEDCLKGEEPQPRVLQIELGMLGGSSSIGGHFLPRFEAFAVDQETA
jgi:hypothetical protein